MNYSLNKLYEVAGISKQAVWAHFKRQQEQLDFLDELLTRVDRRRAQHPGCGVEKLYWQIQPEGIGRDRFCRLLLELGYGLKPTRSKIRTTFAAHKVFANLIEGMAVLRPNQVWQSDITYFRIRSTFYYLTFIIDVYTRLIVGHAVSKTLRAEANLKALNQAITAQEKVLDELIHHSDRGSQYVDKRYLRLLGSHDIAISMGRNAQDNAFAERINGTIKNEYLVPKAPENFRTLKTLTKKAVIDYNTIRCHNELGRIAPAILKQNYPTLKAEVKPVVMIRSERTPALKEHSLTKTEKGNEHPFCSLNGNYNQ